MPYEAIYLDTGQGACVQHAWEWPRFAKVLAQRGQARIARAALCSMTVSGRRPAAWGR